MSLIIVFIFFFFLKQKTAYEIPKRGWSSDVCSSDLLFKIRNCLNIKGERVTLALFQPPIDPMLLVRAKAAGLSIEDIVGQQNEALPPYRFTFLVEKARQYTGTVQALGNALLSALEKKEGE